MPNPKRKGSQWERTFCTRLSLWWTDYKDDDVFWRSQSSGARATTRKKAGRETKGQYSDITAVDSRGAAFTDVFTVELKKGYSKHTLTDLLDRPSTSKQQMWETWIDGAMTNAEYAGSASWMLAVERDRRDALIVTDRLVFQALREIGCFDRRPCPYFEIVTFLRRSHHDDQRIYIAGMHLSQFITNVTPDHIRELSRRL